MLLGDECQHGHLRRSCNECDQENELDRNAAMVEELQELCEKHEARIAELEAERARAALVEEAARGYREVEVAVAEWPGGDADEFNRLMERMNEARIALDAALQEKP